MSTKRMVEEQPDDAPQPSKPVAEQPSNDTVWMATGPFQHEFHVLDYVITPQGVDIPAADADAVREAARKHGVALREQ